MFGARYADSACLRPQGNRSYVILHLVSVAFRVSCVALSKPPEAFAHKQG